MNSLPTILDALATYIPPAPDPGPLGAGATNIQRAVAAAGWVVGAICFVWLLVSAAMIGRYSSQPQQRAGAIRQLGMALAGIVVFGGGASIFALATGFWQ